MSQRLHPGSPVQNMALLTHIDGPVDANRLADSFDVVIRECDVLRTRIVESNGSPLVQLDAEPQERLIIDLPRAAVDAWAAERAAVVIDTSIRGYDSAILVHEDETVSWYLALHHTITDATSSSLVFEATAAVYHGETIDPGSYYRWARRHDDQADLDRTADSATDRTVDGHRKAATVDAKTGTKRSDRAKAHWNQREPSDPIDRLYRPVDRPQAEASRLAVDLDSELKRLTNERLASDYKLLSPDLSWSALLMTASAAYLSTLSGAERFSIGLPVHNRSDDETRDLIGPIMEVFPVDVTLERDDTFRSLHKRISKSIMTTLANALPGAAPTADYAAVVNVIARAGVGSFGSYPSATTWVHSGAIDSSHLLRVQFTAYNQAMALDLNEGAADPEHRERAAGHFLSILQSMLADPDNLVAPPALDAVETAELHRWESAPQSDEQARGVVERLREGLADRSTVAMTDGSSSWTGRDLWEQITGVAAWLRTNGVGPGERVGIELPRSAEAVIAIMATLVAGGSFVPLDVSQPVARRRRLAERAATKLVLSSLPAPEPAVVDPELFAVPAPSDEAYLLFTSGSTGEPKGVPINHGGLADYLRFAVDHYLDPSGQRPVVPLFSALSFDLTMTSLFLPLLTDGELVVIRPDGPAGLSEIASTPRLNWAKATPSHLEILARLLPEDHRLGTVIVGGEAFGAGLAKRLLAVKPGIRIFNEYGPTEAVVGCMIHLVEEAQVDDHREVPIGVPAPGVTLRIVGPDLNRVPIGVAGELCISHPGVTVGYLPDTTTSDTSGTDSTSGDTPFVELDGQRFYRSGDLVRLADPQTLIYLGRIDEQVKVGGIRLEPTEVEDALTAHPAIKGAAVRLWSPTVSEPETRCIRCGLASNVPGVEFDITGLCSACLDFERVAPQVESWFRTEDDLRAKRDEARSRRQGNYDCLHLLSGGKDSTYALYRLVDLGFEPYVLTLDNGFISAEALDNARRSVAELGLEHEIATSEVMNEIFRDSLERHSNVCHGCYKTLYTLATNRAAELGIPMIITGLSRGQLFETRLLPQQFSSGRFDPDAIDRAIVEARKTYHRLDDGPNRLLDTEIFEDDDLFERIEYLDFYRYVDVELAELYAYLDGNAPWVRPSDTGRSTNCLINAAGIYTHIQEQGYHNYAIPYAWDVRLGHKTRSEAIEELDDQLERSDVDELLAAVGYTPNPSQTLTAWVEAVPGADLPTPAEIRAFLSDTLPGHAIPRAFVRVEELPLTTNGKLDTAALPAPERTHRASSGIQVAPESELEATIVAIWEQILRIEPIGADDDFFALGGDSLGALEMNVAVAEAVGSDIPDDFAFLHTTPRDLAAAIEATESTAVAANRPPTESGAWTRENPPPLSAGELAILYEQATRPRDVMFNVGRMFRVPAMIDEARFADSLRAVAATHVPLTWSYGSTRRPLSSSQAVSVDVDPNPISEAELAAQAERFHRSPIDLEAGPLLKAMVRTVDDGSTAVLLVCHHVSGDAESFDRFWPQLDERYSGREPATPEIDYPTFTTWQKESVTESDRDYWLASAAPSAPLAIPRPSPGGTDGFETTVSDVSPRQLKARTGTSAFATALAALVATLRRYSDGDDVGLAMIASSRNHPVAEPLVGYFLNTLPVGLPCSPDDELGELAARASSVIAGNLSHRSYPYSSIIDDRRKAGLEPTGPEVLVVYEKLPTTALGELPVAQSVLSPGTAVTDATFFIEEGDDTIGLGLEYRSDLFDQKTARRLVTDFNTMLVAAVEQPELTVADVELASLEGSLLHGGELEYPDSLLPAIDHNIRTKPNHPAVECDGDHLTWSALGGRSEALAASLHRAGIGPGDRVIVNLPRSTDLIAAIVAVLRVGAAYVPIDPTYPTERIELIADQAGAAAALVETRPAEPLTDNDIVVGPHPAEASVAEPETPVPFVTPQPDQTAYVIFTSGSTGRPRGVPVTHGQLAASTEARSSVYDAPPERFLLISSSSFDSSIVGIFWTLATGGTIIMPTDRQSHDPDELLALFDRASIGHTLLVPTLYHALLERGSTLERWPSHVVVAGEACPASLVKRHFQLRASTALTNEYGPTEATVWATAHHVSPTDDPVPIGGPIPGTWIAVVDEQDRLVPSGVEGQLIIGGAGLVDGYDADDDATEQRFGTANHQAELGNERFFRTGDRAVIANGNVSFLGRLDHQLNLGGVRAEPEDIERVLLAEPSVGAAVVTAADPRGLDALIAETEPTELARCMGLAASSDDPATELRRLLRAGDSSRVRLVAYLEPTPGRPVDVAAVRALATANLPALLRPSTYGVLERLPRTPNGKIDRAAAVDLEPPSSGASSPSGSSQGSGAAAGREDSDIVQPLRALFAETLGLDSVDPDQSFFDLGGHSLLAMELLLKLEREFGTDVTVSSLYDHPSPAALADLIDDGNRPRRQNRFVIPIQPEGSLPPIFAVHVLGVNSEYYRPLAARLGAQQPLFGLGQPTLDLDTTMPTDVVEVAARYRAELTRLAPEGPVTLAAVSLGAVVAYELAQQLLAEGREVAQLALFDAAGPAASESAPTVQERVAIHTAELMNDPLPYLRDRGRDVRERGDRWSDIATGKARSKLGLPLTDKLRIRRFIEANWHSQRTYQFAPYPGAVTVFKAIDDVFTASMADGGMGWQHVVDGPLEIVPVGGEHLSMLAEPHVAGLADELSLRQERALERLATRPPVRATPMTNGGIEAELSSALQNGTFGVTVARLLAEDRTLSVEEQSLLHRADQLARDLAAEARDHAEIAMATVSALGAGAVLEPIPERLQQLSFGIRLVPSGSSDRAGQGAVTTAVEALAVLGYRPQDRMSPGAWQSYVRTHSSCTLIRTDSSTTRLNLSWGPNRVTGPLKPRRADLAAVDLPAAAWPLYHLVRPLRLAGDRARGQRAGGDLGVFLGTPTPMIADILALAEPTEHDLVVDIGCGDGRVLIEAVRRFGCRARGVENNPELAAIARERVARAGFAERIEIIEASAGTSAGTAALAGATIVFLFLPAETTADLLPTVLETLEPEGRVIAHEQVRSNWPIRPDRSQLVMSSGLTIAYLWTPTG